MNKKIAIQDFSAHLFWDVDIFLFDFQKNKEQLVFKVLEYGTIKDWNLLKEMYGLNGIKESALSLRSLDVVTLSFLATIFKIDKSQFRCYRNKQSIQNCWNS